MKQHSFPLNFILCGLYGWCFECLFTGVISIVKKEDKRYPCRTSIWMFPIYGMAAFIKPFGRFMKRFSTLERGLIYTCFIFLTEFLSGSLLKRHNACPWDYSHSRFQYKGLIRFDFAPLWLIMSLIYEKILWK